MLCVWIDLFLCGEHVNVFFIQAVLVLIIVLKIIYRCDAARVSDDDLVVGRRGERARQSPGPQRQVSRCKAASVLARHQSRSMLATVGSSVYQSLLLYSR